MTGNALPQLNQLGHPRRAGYIWRPLCGVGPSPTVSFSNSATRTMTANRVGAGRAAPRPKMLREWPRAARGWGGSAFARGWPGDLRAGHVASPRGGPPTQGSNLGCLHGSHHVPERPEGAGGGRVRTGCTWLQKAPGVLGVGVPGGRTRGRLCHPA